MHNGKIAYFEDSTVLAASTVRGIELFSDDRHQVVAQAANRGGALAVLDQIASGEVDANIVLSDGNLDGGVTGGDAIIIINRIKELGLNVRTVLMSSQSAEDIGVTVDAEFLKDDSGPADLVKILDDLPEIE